MTDRQALGAVLQVLNEKMQPPAPITRHNAAQAIAEIVDALQRAYAERDRAQYATDAVVRAIVNNGTAYRRG